MHGARLRQALTLALGSPSWDVMRRYQKLTADEARGTAADHGARPAGGVGRASEAERAGPADHRIPDEECDDDRRRRQHDQTSSQAPRALRGGAAAAFLAPLVALVVLQRVFFPAPLGVVVNGALFGSRIALIALGIAPIYRANRIINFAQGDLGAVPATLAVMLVVAWNWNYWIGLIAGLAAALVLGVLVETLIIRRPPRPASCSPSPRSASRSCCRGAGCSASPSATSRRTRLAPPFEANFEIGGTNFNANDVLTMIVVPICLSPWRCSCSARGWASPSSVGRAGRPGLTLGIPVKRLHTVVWVVASVLAFLGMFLRAGRWAYRSARSCRPRSWCRPWRPRCSAGSSVHHHRRRRHRARDRRPGHDLPAGNRPAYNDAVLFGIVLAGLLLTPQPHHRPGRHRRLRHLAGHQGDPAHPAGAAPPARGGGDGRCWRSGWGFVLTLPAWLSTSRINLATIIVIFGIVAASLVVLTGWAGQVSLGRWHSWAWARRGRGADRTAAGTWRWPACSPASWGPWRPWWWAIRPCAGRADAGGEHVGLRPVRVAVPAQRHDLSDWLPGRRIDRAPSSGSS